MESCDVLTRVNEQIDEGQRYTPYLKGGTDSATGQNVGLLTRMDPSEGLQRSDAYADYPVEGSG